MRGQSPGTAPARAWKVDRSVAQGRRTGPSHLAPALAVGVVAFALARLALLPGVTFWDTGRVPDRRARSWAPPTRPASRPTCPGLARVGRPPAVRRAGVPDEPPLGDLRRPSPPGVTVVLVRALTGSLASGSPPASGSRLTPIAWAIGTHADAHALHLVLVAILLWLLVGWDARVRGDGRTWAATDRARTAGSSRRRSSSALAVGNHSLTLLLAVPVGLFVLAVEPGHLRGGRGSRWPASAPASRRRVARLPRAAAARRAVPGAARLRPPETWAASGTSSSASSSRAA